MEPNNLPTWMTTDQVAEYLQVTPETVRRWIRAGALPVLDVGGRKGGYRIRSRDLDTFIGNRFGTVGKIAA